MDAKRRQQELELKRQKLAELRKAREERTKVSTVATSPSLNSSKLTSPVQTPVVEKKDIDDLVASLVGRGSTATSVTPPALAVNTQAPIEQPPTISLMESSTVLVDIPPKVKVIYDKECQTSQLLQDESEREQLQTESLITESLREKLRAELLAEVAAESTANNPVKQQQPQEQPTPQPRELSDQEREIIEKSEKFSEFINSSSRLVERALCSKEPFDILRDYSSADSPGNNGEISMAKGARLICQFGGADERWTRNRSVRDISWSIKYPELVLASYSKNHSSSSSLSSSSPSDPDGVVLIWNANVPGRPEFTFHCQSEVTAASFSPFHPKLVVGGTYSGQIVLWDMRSRGSAGPVLKSPLSAAAGHMHPVFCVQVIGTANAHHLLSTSTDGQLCAWQLDMLSQPLESLDLSFAGEEISVTTFSFPEMETTSFLAGSEDGRIYGGSRYDRAGVKAGLHGNIVYGGHFGAVTSIDFHGQSGAVDFSDLFISSSFDWTVKLWSAKTLSKPTSLQSGGGLSEIRPLVSFESATDYVFDCKWSPGNPAVFSSVDGSGCMDIWNLVSDLEQPIVKLQVTENGSALNKFCWDPSGSASPPTSEDYLSMQRNLQLHENSLSSAVAEDARPGK